MPSVSRKSTGSKNHAAQKNKKPIRHHVKASIEDINWVRSQLPCVQQLWLDCVAAEQFGKQERNILTNLSDKSFRAAKLALEDKGLFRFIPVCTISKSGRSLIVGWKVENLHGKYYTGYWEVLPAETENLPEEEAETTNTVGFEENQHDSTQTQLPKNSCINIFWYNKWLFFFTLKKFEQLQITKSLILTVAEKYQQKS